MPMAGVLLFFGAKLMTHVSQDISFIKSGTIPLFGCGCLKNEVRNFSRIRMHAAAILGYPPL
jgi:hypothetical protein